MRPVLKLVGLVLGCCCATASTLACDDDGTTTACEEMPLADEDEDEDEDVSSRDQEVRAWWERAAGERCATPPIGGFAGAAGASN